MTTTLNTSDLIADLKGMGLSEADAWRFLDLIDRLTDGVTPDVAAARVRQLVANVLARRSRPAGEECVLVPLGLEQL
jgi:hypothetical protein